MCAASTTYRADAATTRGFRPARCRPLLSLGLPTLTDAHLNRLAALADGDRRVVNFGLEDGIIHADERLRTRARATMSALEERATPEV
jgi:hypothetical protein